MNDKTVEEYAQWLDAKCSHPYYQHVKNFQEASKPVNPPSQTPPSEPPQPPGGTNQCIVCMDAPMQVILIPCHHICVCQACSTHLNSKCPVCRMDIQKVETVFIV